MLRILAPIIIVFFVLSGLSLPTAQQQEGSDVGLRKIVQQVQNLSSQSNPEAQDFASTFRSTVAALQAVAGIKTIIVKKARQESENPTAIIVCVNLPFLLEAVPELDINISDSDLNISKRLIADTSVILPLDTPPPMFV